MTALFKMEETDREARDDGGACPARHAPSISRLQSGTSWLGDSGRAANRACVRSEVLRTERYVTFALVSPPQHQAFCGLSKALDQSNGCSFEMPCFLAK